MHCYILVNYEHFFAPILLKICLLWGMGGVSEKNCFLNFELLHRHKFEELSFIAGDKILHFLSKNCFCQKIVGTAKIIER